MVHRTFEDDDGRAVTELDAEAIEYLIEGLEQLRELDPGEELTTPSFLQQGDTAYASAFVLLRAPDNPPTTDT